MLACARVLQGLGGGGLMTLSQALIGETIPPRERARYQGYLAAVMVTSSTFGPVAGGYLTQHFGWRSVFLVNVPLGLIAVLLTLRLSTRADAGAVLDLRHAGPGAVHRLHRRRCCWRSTYAQRMSAGALPGSACCWPSALAALVALLVRGRSAPASRCCRSQLLRQPTIWRSDALAACHGAALVSLVTFLPIYLRVVRGTSASETGLLLLPLMFGIGAGSMITGRIVSRTGLTTIFPSVGLMLPPYRC